MEKAHRQYVSGWMLGDVWAQAGGGTVADRLGDDVKPGAHPYAVLSYDYWSRRFGGDPKVVGRTFRIGNDVYEIVGVVEQGFTGTETGTLTDIFIPTMMNAEAIDEPQRSWFRTWVQLRPGAGAEQVRQKLQASLLPRAAKGQDLERGTPRERIEHYVNAPVFLEPAAAGVSGMQKTYRRRCRFSLCWSRWSC